ncbi:MAG: 16S rRNA (guanine(527)-N(7))-methyltransferase RsmG [Spirochaetales bacterium]|nr:16S rRNA (guanine(527)-N(7))-methyltransferase RsmG [Spirochaetales bacterium]
MKNSEILEEGLNRLGIKYESYHLDKLNLYMSEIELWNGKYKLVGASGQDLVIRHILDSLSAVPTLGGIKFSTASDIGSGAGLPGIPLALFFPGVRFSLIERSGRRIGFLRNIVSLLNLGERIDIIESGVEDIDGNYDLVLFRAFRNLNDYYKILSRITAPGGTLFAYKGRIENIRQELSSLGDNIRADIKKINVPFLDEERNFCIFKPGSYDI